MDLNDDFQNILFPLSIKNIRNLKRNSLKSSQFSLFFIFNVMIIPYQHPKFFFSFLNYNSKLGCHLSVGGVVISPPLLFNYLLEYFSTSLHNISNNVIFLKDFSELISIINVSFK